MHKIQQILKHFIECKPLIFEDLDPRRPSSNLFWARRQLIASTKKNLLSVETHKK